MNQAALEWVGVCAEVFAGSLAIAFDLFQGGA